jgi:hypothetical protein
MPAGTALPDRLPCTDKLPFFGALVRAQLRLLADAFIEIHGKQASVVAMIILSSILRSGS